MGLNSDKLASVGMALLLAYVALTGVLRAAAKPFWCDEIITVGLVRLPSYHLLRDALEHAADSHPPPFYLVEGLAARLTPNELIAFRLPSIVAFCALLLCVFVFIRKTRGSVCALICALIPLLSVLFYPFAVEARGYSLMAGFAAFAMVCYQRAEKTAWWVLLGLSLMAGVASHYYAVFSVLPFGLAELAVVVQKRRFRIGVWFALFISVVPLVAYWPLLQACKQAYASHYHGHLSMMEIAKSYGFVFNLPPTPGVGLAAAAFTAVLVGGWVSGYRASLTNATRAVPLQEHVLALGVMALPLMMYVILRVTHGGFTDRYMLVTALGFPLAASYVLSAMEGRVATVFCVLLLVSLGLQEASFWQRELQSFGQKDAPAEGFEQFVATAGYPNLPVIVSDAIAYVQLAYYASPEGKRRLVFLSDPAAAVIYSGSDNADKCVAALRPYLGLQVHDFRTFAESQPQFLLYSDGAGIWDWLPTRLAHDGYSMEVAAMNQEKRIYLVRTKPPSQSSSLAK